MIAQRIFRSRLLLFVLTNGMILGCSSPGPTTYPITGRVELAEGQSGLLSGHHVEIVLSTDPTIRAAGVIQPDGRFTLETIHSGTLHLGAKEGTYQARVVLSDDDPESRKQATKAIAARFFQFSTSGLSIRVPTKEEVTLQLSRR
jgi:hypothetical protein